MIFFNVSYINCTGKVELDETGKDGVMVVLILNLSLEKKLLKSKVKLLQFYQVQCLELSLKMAIKYWLIFPES